MIVTVAAPDDLQAIEFLRREAFSHFAPRYYTSAEVGNLLADFNAEEAATMIEEQRLFVARDGNRSIACAGWHGESIRHVYVSPALTGQGLGRRILLHAEGDFRQRTGAREVAAGVVVYARGFYERNGYRVLSREKDWDGSAYYRMTKIFPSQTA